MDSICVFIARSLSRGGERIDSNFRRVREPINAFDCDAISVSRGKAYPSGILVSTAHRYPQKRDRHKSNNYISARQCDYNQNAKNEPANTHESDVRSVVSPKPTGMACNNKFH